MSMLQSAFLMERLQRSKGEREREREERREGEGESENRDAYHPMSTIGTKENSDTSSVAQ